ncbi:MAG: NAD(P)H-dependent oxidoreductase subunit E [Terracidiphilus sp.]
MQVRTPDPLSPQEKLLIEQSVGNHENRPGALLGILEAVQRGNPHRFLSLPALEAIAEKTGLPAARIYSAASFFALFNLVPQGEHTICVCRGTACHTRGSRDLLEKLCMDLGLSAGEGHELSSADKLSLTTADRKFTIRTVACFGQCALAPVAEINHQVLGHVNERTLQREVHALMPRRG